MKKAMSVVFFLGFVVGAMLIMSVDDCQGLVDDPSERYSVRELADAIATREANYAELAVELEGTK